MTQLGEGDKNQFVPGRELSVNLLKVKPAGTSQDCESRGQKQSNSQQGLIKTLTGPGALKCRTGHAHRRNFAILEHPESVVPSVTLKSPKASLRPSWNPNLLT